jgi:hypothetical protein
MKTKSLLVRAVVAAASTLSILTGAVLPLYPGAKLDIDYERTKLKLPKIESKQYITTDSFDKVTAFYKKLAPVSPEWTLDTPGNKRLSFREKGDRENSTTVEWSTDVPANRDKVFIVVNTRK